MGQSHALWICSLKLPLGGKPLEHGSRSLGGGCQNILQAATCYLPTRIPALPLPSPCMPALPALPYQMGSCRNCWHLSNCGENTPAKQKLSHRGQR